MSCHWVRQGSGAESAGAGDVIAAYLDLARTGRKEEFRWLALSQGVPPADVEELWQRTLARLGR